MTAIVNQKGVADFSAAAKDDPSIDLSPESCLKSLKFSGSLTELIFSGLPNITNYHFYQLSVSRKNNLETVRVVDLSYCLNISDHGIYWITIAFPNLENLNATGCPLITENSVRCADRQLRSLVSANFDLTGLLYIPSGIKKDVFKFNNCSLLPCDGQSPAPLSSDFVFCKVVIYKTVAFHSFSVASKLFDNIEYISGSDEIGCTWYKCGQFSVVEYVEDGSVQLVISENCLILLPYSTSSTVNQQFYSVENRLKFIASCVECFRAACIPIGESLKKENHRAKKFKSIKDMIVENCQQNASANEAEARYRYLVENCFELVLDKSELLTWMDSNKPYADISNLSLPSTCIENMLKFIKGKSCHFITVDKWINLMNENLSPPIAINNWSRIIQFLFESGNIWRERFIGHDSRFPGPHHILSSSNAFITFIAEFRGAKDSTAMAEDLCCLPPTTPLCSMDRIKSLLKSPDSEIFKRLLTLFEFSGLGIFRDNMALAMWSLGDEPVVDIKHFTAEFDENQKTKPSFLTTLRYSLVTYPPILLRRIIAVLAKLYTPMLMWDNGIFFYDSFFLEVYVKADNQTTAITVQFSADIIATRPDILSAVEATCATINSICCAILNNFSNDDLLKVNPKGKNLVDTNRSQILNRLTNGIGSGNTESLYWPAATEHVFDRKNNDATSTFTRTCVSSTCLHCHISPEVIEAIERLQAGSMLNMHTGLLYVSARVLLDNFGPTNYTSVPKRFDVALFHGTTEVKVYANSPYGCKSEPLIIKNEGNFKESPVTVELVRSSDGKVVATASISGRKLLSVDFSRSVEYVTILASGNSAPIPLISRSKMPPKLLSSLATVVDMKVGMRLEARNPRYRHLICVASVKKINGDDECLIHFDGLSDGFSFWINIGSSSQDEVFPCGFVEYLNKSPDKMAKFKEKTSFSGALRTPRGSSFEESSKAFPWQQYFDDLKDQLKVDVEPVPFDAFCQDNLLGFPRDFLWLKQMRPMADLNVLGKLCAASKLNVLESVKESFKQTNFMHSFVPFMPLNLCDFSWELCLWPSRYKLTSFNTISLLCGFADLHHFVNEPSISLTLPIKTAPVFAELVVLLLIRMLTQPRCFPDRTDNLFPKLSTPPSFTYALVQQEKQYNRIENSFRRNIFPNMIDYLLVAAYSNPPANDSETSFSSKLTAIRHLIDTNVVTILQNSKLLLSMSLKEEDFFVKHQFCPRIMCEQHAFQLISYSEASLCGRIRTMSPQNANAVDIHDSLLTKCLFTTEEFSAVKSSISIRFPYISELWIGSCSLATFPLEICSLKCLSELNISSNDLMDLPDQFAQLVSLTRLDVSANKFEALPSPVYKLVNLLVLRADNLPLKNLSQEIGKLSNLRFLSLKNNALTALLPEISHLKHLEVLDLSGPVMPSSNDSLYYDNVAAFCKYHNFPAFVLPSFHGWTKTSGPKTGWLDQEGVERLRLYFFAQIARLEFPTTGFPIEILSLSELRELTLANQNIIYVPDEIQNLKKLQKLDLSNCLNLEKVSAKISSENLRILKLDGCSSLKTPPYEIRKRGMLAIIAYFRRLATGFVACRRCKLMCVGLGGAGKTTLTKALISPSNFADLSNGDLGITDGIAITNWNIANVDFRIWDFAGQVVYYNTHQFFLSRRAVYLVIWNMRLGYQHAGLDFWLSSIAVHAPDAPVLVIGTQADLVSQERTVLPETMFRERFSNIRGFFYISSRTGTGIPALRDHIVQAAQIQKHMGEHIPSAWLSFEQNLLKAGESNKSILMFDEVRKMADISGVFEEEETLEALTFLSDLGSIQFFRNDYLCDRVIIHPQWIVDALSSLISVRKSSNIKDGILQHQQLASIWDGHSQEIHQWLLTLTEAFDLTFKLKGQKASLIPCLLPEDHPKECAWSGLDPESKSNEKESHLIFLFRYLPSGLFNRAQVRLSAFSDESQMWRTGSLLRKNNHSALVSITEPASVSVKVKGVQPENLLFLIYEVFDGLITESFENIRPDILFSCPECVEARVLEPSLFRRSKIRRASELHVPFVQCSEYFHCVSTRELRQILPAESSVDFDFQLVRNVTTLSGLSDSLKKDVLVISCKDNDVNTNKDSVPVTEIVNDIKNNMTNVSVALIADPDSMPFDQLSTVLRSSRVILCCISPSFMASDRCQAMIFCARETYRKQLIVAFVRDFDWKSFSALAFLIGNDVYIRAFSRNKYQPSQVADLVKLRLEQSSAVDLIIDKPAGKTNPPVFISYCWQNSKDAVDRGTRPSTNSVGICDPRAIKSFLAENGVDCWLDIEQVSRGTGALFENIALGLRHARVVVVCISDEYCESTNCLREFRFAHSACSLPIILCAVGNGCLWRQSEVTLVAANAIRINFQLQLKENYQTLLTAVKEYIPQESNVKRPKKLALRKKDALSPSIQEATLFYSELLELTQRRFLHHLSLNATSSKHYPLIMILDLVAENQQAPPPDNCNAEDDVINTQKWCFRLFCECDAGWHLTEANISCDSKAVSISSMLRSSASYHHRVLSLIKHSQSTLPQLLSPSNTAMAPFCQHVVIMLEKMTKFEDPFDEEYNKLRDEVISLDKQKSFGGLVRCQLAIGRDLWLCKEHQLEASKRTSTKITPTQANSNGEDEASIEQNEFVSSAMAIQGSRPFSSLKTSRACVIQ